MQYIFYSIQLSRLYRAGGKYVNTCIKRTMDRYDNTEVNFDNNCAAKQN